MSETEVTVTPELSIVRWAAGEILDTVTRLTIDHGPLPSPLHGAPAASGKPLVTNGTIGADLLRLPSGAGFVPHTHPGHHVLMVVAGHGTITYAGRIYPTQGGEVYLIEGQVPHAVGAISEHLIVAVGAPHRGVDAEDRMAPVPYEEVLAPEGDIECLVCGRAAEAPASLHQFGCSHCPCYECLGG